jgi:Family of unknown function (DUF6151)
VKSNISLKCSCGQLRGVISDVSNNTGRRGVCMCDDCQTYAHYLGRASEILDQHGGTDVFPVEPAKIKITAGGEQLKCVRLAPNGMFRWYAGCCKTPIANSLKSYKIPFTGVVHLIMDHKSDGITRDQAIGPVQAKFNSKFGINNPPKEALIPMAGLILNSISFLLQGWIKGANQPSPFFDHQGKPKVEPYILTETERANLRKLCGPKPNDKASS